MSASRAHHAPLLNSLLGMAIIVAAGINILFLAAIGWAAWERATLSEAWEALLDTGPLAAEEAAALLDLLAGTEGSLAALSATLPTDADIARFVAALQSEAATANISITNLSVEAAPAGPLPRRVFLLRAQGAGPRLLAFLTWTARSAPGSARIEDVTFTADDAGASLSFRLLIAVRASGH